MGLQAGERPLLVRAHQARIARHIGGENGGQPAVDAFRGQSGAPEPQGPNRLSALGAHCTVKAFVWHSLLKRLPSATEAARRRRNRSRGSGSTIPRRARSAHIWASAGRLAAVDPLRSGRAARSGQPRYLRRRQDTRLRDVCRRHVPNPCRRDARYARARNAASSSARKRAISPRRSRSKRVISAVEQFPSRIQITFGGDP